MKTKEEVLDLLWEIYFYMVPVDWDNKYSVKNFKDKSDAYAKIYNKLSNEEQGWVTEQFNIFMKENT